MHSILDYKTDAPYAEAKLKEYHTILEKSNQCTQHLTIVYVPFS